MASRTGFLTLLLVAGLLAAACSSPEATRTRSGGPGADTGNRGAAVELHGVAKPYYRTPAVGQGVRK